MSHSTSKRNPVPAAIRSLTRPPPRLVPREKRAVGREGVSPTHTHTHTHKHTLSSPQQPWLVPGDQPSIAADLMRSATAHAPELNSCWFKYEGWITVVELNGVSYCLQVYKFWFHFAQIRLFNPAMFFPGLNNILSKCPVPVHPLYPTRQHHGFRGYGGLPLSGAAFTYSCSQPDDIVTRAGLHDNVPANLLPR